MSNGFVCPYCKMLSQMNQVNMDMDIDETYSYVIYKCENCSGIIFRCYSLTQNEDCDVIVDKIIHQYPEFQAKTHSSVPNEISEMYGEGVRCLNANAPNGAMVCFHKCLQKICLHKGADQKHELWQQVDSILQDRVRKISLDIRKLKVIGTQDNTTSDPSFKQAKQVKEFLDLIFLDEFELPAKIEASKQQLVKASS